ncbi:site-2 protease family protein [Nocardiopsis sp. LOL_012]|uniref:site-2 protease family protein n=1 Tax=Nocardiopsis sp. LOL_012 TaxID=3345409 RepID=UPI003A8954E2
MTESSDDTSTGPRGRSSGGQGLVLGRPFGVPVHLSASWLIVAALITVVYGGIAQDRLALGPGAYLLAFVFAVLLYASVLVHELAHALVARRYGLPVRRIVLYALGGVSEIEREAPTPGREFWIAFAGPALSLVLAGLGYLLWLPVDPLTVVGELLLQLWVANLLVGVFNLLPGLPLDGGRLLRAAVWRMTGRPYAGSVAAAWGGRVLALAIVALPLVPALWSGASPDPWALVWGLVLGGFIWMGSTEALGNARMRARVPGLRAGALARPAVAVAADTPLAEADRRAAGAGADAIVVVDPEGAPVSIVHRAAAEAIPRERRPWVPVSSVSRGVGREAVVPAALEGEELLEALSAHPLAEYPVVGLDGRVHGVLRSVDVNLAMRGRGAG